MTESFRTRRDAFLDKVRRRPVVMGILNVTPDSFFDGGRFQAADAALAQAERLAMDGCDIIDVVANRHGRALCRYRSTKNLRASTRSCRRWRAASTCRCRSTPPRPP